MALNSFSQGLIYPRCLDFYSGMDDHTTFIQCFDLGTYDVPTGYLT